MAAKAQIEELYAGKAASEAKIAELEASLAVQQQTSRMLMTAVQEAADSAQKRISKLEEEMVSLNLERSVVRIGRLGSSVRMVD